MSFITASSAGVATGYFDIPPNTPAGAKLVQFLSPSSTATSLLTVKAETTFLGRGVVTNREIRRITTTDVRQTYTWRGDPVAQTFTLDADRMCNGVDLLIYNKGVSNIAVVIRECDNGWPTSRFLCGKVLRYSQCSVSTSTSANVWTRFSWPAVRLEANQEYAVTVMADDATASVRYAELGKRDTVNSKWLTQQAYTIGVMLVSANNSTWTPLQNQDLAFRLLEPSYTPVNSASGLVTKSVAFTSCSVTSADYLIVNAAVERPMPDTDCVFELSLYPSSATTAIYTVSEGQPLLLPVQYSGAVNWRAIMQGAAHQTPILHKDVQLISGKGRTSGTYISRAIPMNATSASSARMTVNLTARLPQGSNVEVRAQVGVDASNNPVWSSAFASYGDPVALQDNFYERAYTASGFSVSDTRLYISLSGTAQARPEIKSLQAIVMAV